MRLFICFVFGAVAGVCGFAIAQTVLPVVGSAVLIHHDATGRTQSSTAKLNSVSYDSGILSVTYTSDAMFCSAFGQ